MTLKTLSLATAALGGLSLTTAAQTGISPTAVDAYSVTLPGTGPFGGGGFENGVLANTIPGAYPDYFGLRDGVLVRMAEVGVYDSFHSVTTGVVDVDTIYVGGSGDAIAGAGTTGVFLAQVNIATGNTVLQSVDGTYSSGVQVECADLTGDGQDDLLVLDSGRDTIRVWERSGQTWSLTHTLSFPGETIGDFDLAQLRGKTQNHDLLLALDDGFRAYQFTAGLMTPIYERVSPNFQFSQIEVLRGHGPGGADGFAWTARVASIGRWILSGGWLGVMQPGDVLPLGVEVVGMATGAMDDDGGPGLGGDDVVLSLTDSREVLVGFNQGGISGQSLLGFAGFTAYETGYAAVSGGQWPVIGDTDGNLRGEIYIGHDGSSTGDFRVLYDADGSGIIGFASSDDVRWAQDLPWDYLPGSQTDYRDIDVGLGTTIDLTTITEDWVVSVWLQPAGSTDFNAVAIGHCDDGAVTTAPGSDQYYVGFDGPVDDISNSDTIAIRVETATPLANGRRPVLIIAATGTGTCTDSPLLTNPGLIIETGEVVHDWSGGPCDGGTNPAGLIVTQRIKVKRIKFPPSTPSDKGTADCGS